MSKIEWTDAVWNPLAGCTRTSPGCDNCYAALMALRLEAMALADLNAGRVAGRKHMYIGVARRTPSGRAAFNGTINTDDTALTAPLRWKKPRRVFVNSMSDLFHKDVPFGFIDRVFQVMTDTPQHTYQMLTKRPERMAEYTRNRVETLTSNIWCGTSVENQQCADERIPHLLRVPAAVRFLSCEPLLQPVDLSSWMVFAGQYEKAGWMLHKYGSSQPLAWVIVGGESGGGARPMSAVWARNLRDQCQAASIPFFFKQWGETHRTTNRSYRMATSYRPSFLTGQ